MSGSRRPAGRRPATAAFVLGLLVAVPAARAQPAEDAEARGDRLMAEFRTLDAAAAYRAGLAVAPDDPTLLWKTSRALANRAVETEGLEGDEALLEEAVVLARRAVRADPGAARPRSTLATALGRYGLVVGRKHRMGRAGEVAAIAREAWDEGRTAARLDPQDFAAFTFLGVMAREMATVHPVIRAVARTFWGGFPDVELEHALGYLRRARRLAPGDVTTRLELARTYLEADREAAAREELRAAVAIPPREALDRVEREQARRLLAELERASR